MSDLDDWKKEYVRKGDLAQYVWMTDDKYLDVCGAEVVSFETIKALPAAKVIPVELHNDRMKVQNRNRRGAELQYAGIVNSLYKLIDYFEDEAKSLEEVANETREDGIWGQVEGIQSATEFLIELVSGCEPPDGFQSRARLDDRYGISVQGTVEVPGTVSYDEFWDKFIGFVEENGWYFAGSMEESRFEE